MSDVDDRIPHPTHLGLNIAKVIPDDRPAYDGDRLVPHPDPDRVAAPVREVLPHDGTLPSTEYLDQIAGEAGGTLARVWELPHDQTIRWLRDALAEGLGDRSGGGGVDHSGHEQADADRDADHHQQRADQP